MKFSAKYVGHYRMLPHAPRRKNAYSSRFEYPGNNNEKSPVDNDTGAGWCRLCEAGHMMYIHEPSMVKFKEDLAKFISGE